MIKEMDNFEINEVMDIWLETNIVAHGFMPKQYWLDNYDTVKKHYMPIAKTFIYKEDAVVKAFISIIDNAFIGALFVAKDYQGQGIGLKLIDYCKSLYSSLELAVYTENINAVNFYKYCGFVITSEQLNEDSGYKEYLMAWSKKEP
ncbi:N-acetyltransferase [Propionispora sp. 2/2-37]|uniref:N-acetyltransferase n=1 Tax=Propionispora sp. 2/2-37 TaxID=1677858 RepID=UPI0006BB5BE1|nr:N-acetyltransferase [Propionispora sp. 2/2-37]